MNGSPLNRKVENHEIDANIFKGSIPISIIIEVEKI